MAQCFLESGNLYTYNSVVCGLNASFFHHQSPIANHLLKTTATREVSIQVSHPKTSSSLKWLEGVF